jgi:hypothetical protein
VSELKTVLPTDSAARKNIPLVRGLLDYFPAALAAVAEVSQAGNDKHNPGEPLHWARGKSGDHADCIVRHIVDRGTIDPEDNLRHSAKVAWRALALLQEELEAAGAATPRGAWTTQPEKSEPEYRFKCTDCESTRIYGHDKTQGEIAEIIRTGRAKGWAPCDNMRCAGHLQFAL